MQFAEHCRPRLLLAALFMTGACQAQPATPDIDAIRRQAEALQRTLAALPPACTVGAAPQAPANGWHTAPKAFPEPGHAYVIVQQFGQAIAAGAVRAALNPAALAALDKVETRDAQGRWVDAGPLKVRAAPAGCAYVWLQQDLGGTRTLDALRYTFHRTDAPQTIANAGALVSH